jgi:ribose transport system ATP-binding protein
MSNDLPACRPTRLLEVRAVTKRFPGVVALDRVEMLVEPGEVLAVIGENGAGKSTLMKILAGVQSADSGQLLVDGESLEIVSGVGVEAALAAGIALIHQELNLADNLDIASNIFLGREPRRGPGRVLIDHRQAHERSWRFLRMVGLDLDPATPVSELSIGRQQLVEIAKALSVDARVLIMDEPTSSLSEVEAESLFAVIEQLRDAGRSIVYISHRLGEVLRLADRVTVLRDGANAGELSGDEITHDAMVRLMVGRDIELSGRRTERELGEVVLEARGLRSAAFPAHGLDFSIRSGEIVGLAGLVGAGRTELLETVFGITRALGGRLQIGESDLLPSDPFAAIEAGLALVPEDRKRQGLVLEMSVGANLSLASLKRDSWAGWLNRRRERSISDEMIGRLRVKTPGREQVVRYLSGGNQQKVVLGKWLAMEPRVLLMDEPTRGIDVGAKQEIYELMEELALRGVAILFVSSEMEEVLRMSDRVLVMHEGRIAGELDRAVLEGIGGEESVMRLATGGVG